MTPLKIKAKMVMAGISQTAIAGDVGVTQSAVSKTIHGVIFPRRIQEAVARGIGEPRDRVFPPRRKRKNQRTRNASQGARA
jgi:transcriptional regulator with XRE-family HTH domain